MHLEWVLNDQNLLWVANYKIKISMICIFIKFHPIATDLNTLAPFYHQAVISFHMFSSTMNWCWCWEIQFTKYTLRYYTEYSILSILYLFTLIKVGSPTNDNALFFDWDATSDATIKIYTSDSILRQDPVFLMRTNVTFVLLFSFSMFSK